MPNSFSLPFPPLVYFVTVTLAWQSQLLEWAVSDRTSQMNCATTVVSLSQLCGHHAEESTCWRMTTEFPFTKVTVIPWPVLLCGTLEKQLSVSCGCHYWLGKTSYFFKCYWCFILMETKIGLFFPLKASQYTKCMTVMASKSTCWLIVYCKVISLQLIKWRKKRYLKKK